MTTSCLFKQKRGIQSLQQEAIPQLFKIILLEETQAK